MPATSSTSKQNTARAIYAYTEDLLAQGRTKLEVEKALVEKGMKPDLAGAVVERVVKAKVQSRQSLSSRPKLLRGLLVLFIGFSSLWKGLSSPGEYGWIGGCMICIFYGILWMLEWRKSNA